MHYTLYTIQLGATFAFEDYDWGTNCIDILHPFLHIMWLTEVLMLVYTLMNNYYLCRLDNYGILV